MRTAAGSPEGRTYLVRAETPDKALTEELMTSLFGQAVLGYFLLDAEGKSAVDDCAALLTPGGACELIVFRCTDSRDTPSLARLCLSRLDSLRQQDYLLTDGGHVYVIDNYVILAVCDSPDSVRKAAMSVIK